MRIARKVIREVMEEQRAISEEMAKTSKPRKKPLFGVSSMPSGLEVANATVAIRVATTEQDVAVFISQLPPALTRLAWS